MLYIGIDLGTSAVKLLLLRCGSTGEPDRIERVVSKEYPICYPQPGWSEQQPQDWYEQTMAGLRELLADCDKGQVAGLSFGGQMHGLVLLDEQDEVIRPAILWNDGRTTEECDYLNRVVGKEKLSQYTANIAFPGFTAPKILWVKRHEPQNFAKIKKIMLPKDYLAYRLTGAFSTDVSDASGMLLMNVKERCWSEEMLEICGITREQLPTIYESWQPVGKLRQELARELGLCQEVLVAAGAGDNAAAAVGTATVGENRCNISLGTSGTVFLSSKQFRVDPNNALHAFAHADGSYHVMGCMLSAASCNRWWMEDILHTGQYDAEQKGMEELGRNDVFFLPYLMGERSPHNDADARGMFVGMSMSTTRQQMTQAVLEGVAFALRDSLEVAKSMGIVPSRSKICGGGAKSPLWKTIIANVLNLQIDTVEHEEGPALGAALLAAVACGAFASVEEAALQFVHVKETISPQPELVQQYEEQYQKFRQIYPMCRPLFQVLK